jgi:hypothetical protein
MLLIRSVFSPLEMKKAGMLVTPYSSATALSASMSYLTTLTPFASI